MSEKHFNADDVGSHCTENDLWIILDGQVYDLSAYLKDHPGGKALLRQAGRDATAGFQAIPAHKYVKGLISQILERHRLGRLDQDSS